MSHPPKKHASYVIRCRSRGWNAEAFRWTPEVELPPWAAHRCHDVECDGVDCLMVDDSHLCQPGNWIVHLENDSLEVLRQDEFDAAYEKKPLPSPQPVDF